MQTKICKKCQLEKTIDNFYKQASKKDGIDMYCKKCNYEFQKKVRERYQKENQKEPRKKIQSKICSKCKRELPINEFGLVRANHDGYNIWCKECNGISALTYRLNNDLHISMEKYNYMVNDQAGVCAICGKKPSGRRLIADCNHKTGTVRGLLCLNCKSSMGFLVEDTEIMHKMIQYIERWKNV